MPRAPHSSTLLAGRPAAKRPVLSIEDVADAVDAADQPDIDAVDTLHRLQKARIGGPDEAVGGGEIGRRRAAGASRDTAAISRSSFSVKRLDRLVGHVLLGLLLREPAL